MHNYCNDSTLLISNLLIELNCRVNTTLLKSNALSRYFRKQRNNAFRIWISWWIAHILNGLILEDLSIEEVHVPRSFHISVHSLLADTMKINCVNLKRSFCLFLMISMLTLLAWGCLATLHHRNFWDATLWRRLCLTKTLHQLLSRLGSNLTTVR